MRRDVIAGRNVLVYQSLDDGDIVAIDADRNVTHVVVDNRVIVSLDQPISQTL